MTGRELIVYILLNGLEDKPVFENGTFIGFISDKELATKMNVGVPTVHALADMGIYNGTRIGDTMYFAGNVLLTAERGEHNDGR